MRSINKPLKNKIFYCTILMLVLMTGIVDAQLNTNGGFESSAVDTVSGTDVEGWVIELATGADALFEIVADTVRVGMRALKITVDIIGTNDWDIQVVADSIPVQQGETYRYSVWAKSSGSSQVSFTVGNYDFKEYGVIRPGSPNVTTSWQEYTFTFTIDDAAEYIRAPIHFSITANTGDNIYIDNLRIYNVADVWEGPPLASSQPKFVGNIYSPPQLDNFEAYWNQVTPENAGKWGSVEAIRDVMNWEALDAAYNLAKDNGFPFDFHVLIWGSQQPAWIDGLLPTEQLEEIREWFQAVANRYDDIDYLQVVNEPLPGHNPPDGTGDRANYKEALGGDGETGWDWVLNAFRMAREIFPSQTKLMLNDFNIINSSGNTSQYLNIIRLLQAENLIDVIGEQAHTFTTNVPVATMKRNLDSLAATGLPIQITEMDISYSDDNIQLQNYQQVFPALYEHPGVEGITLWGWRPGTWQADAYLLNQDGSERPALVWLREYLDSVNVTALVKDINKAPQVFHLYNNYPNPFNPVTRISYDIAKTVRVRINVYDITGRLVKTIVSDVQIPGRYTVTFNAEKLSSGMYFYHFKAGSFSEVKLMLLIK
jgi:GH35 family endo-1,4-beta-xylanase